jgi:hypothetical protein
MSKIDLKVERQELLDGGVGSSIRRAKYHAGEIVDRLMQIYIQEPELIETMKNLITLGLMLEQCAKKMDLLEDYIENLEKDLNINQESPEPYCSDCGRGGG